MQDGSSGEQTGGVHLRGRAIAGYLTSFLEADERANLIAYPTSLRREAAGQQPTAVMP